MLKQLLDLTAKLFSLNRDVQQSKSDIAGIKQQITEMQRDIKALQKEMHDLARGFDRASFEVRLLAEHEAHERANLALRLENELLKFERRLPSGKSDE